MSSTFALPSGLLSSLCFVESKHSVTAYHAKDGATSSLGVCQIKLATARGLGFKGNEQQLMNPKINVYYAAKYLNKQITRYQGDVQKAVAAYNAGTYRPGLNGKAKNHNYVRKVLLAWQSRT